MENKISHAAKPKQSVEPAHSRIPRSSLRLKPKTHLGKQQIVKINTILTHLFSQADSIDFREPVDWEAMELLDYPDIIHNPMDLGTVNNNLKEHKYKTVEEVLNDTQLVWDNCKFYNPVTSKIYSIADKLEAIFRRMIRNYLPNLRVSSVPSVPYRPIAQKPFNVIYQPERDNQSQKYPVRAKRNVQSKYQKIDKMDYSVAYNKSRLISKPVSTIQTKKDFVKKLNNLSSEQLSVIIEKIQTECPTAFNTLQNDYACLNVERLDEDCFFRTNQVLDGMLNIGKFSHAKN